MLPVSNSDEYKLIKYQMLKQKLLL